MKKTIIGLLAAVAITGGMATLAEAKVNFKIYLGEPYYDHRIGPDYRYYEGRGWYRPQQASRQYFVRPGKADRSQ